MGDAAGENTFGDKVSMQLEREEPRRRIGFSVPESEVHGFQARYHWAFSAEASENEGLLRSCRIPSQMAVSAMPAMPSGSRSGLGKEVCHVNISSSLCDDCVNLESGTVFTTASLRLVDGMWRYQAPQTRD